MTEPDAAPHPGFIYVIQLGRERIVKIGYSREPIRRATQLQGGSGLEMRLLMQFVGSKAGEAALQSRFAANRLGSGREWFRLTGDVAKWIDAVRLPQVNPDQPPWSFGSAPVAEPVEPGADILSDWGGHFGAWWAACVRLDSGGRELAAALWASFSAWCRAAGLPANASLSQAAFGRMLADRGVIRAGKDGQGRVRRIGARLIEGNSQ